MSRNPNVKLGRPSWPEDQVQFLRDHAETLTAAVIGQHIGRSTCAVWAKAKHLKINLTFRKPRTPKGVFSGAIMPVCQKKGGVTNTASAAESRRVASMMELSARISRRSVAA